MTRKDYVAFAKAISENPNSDERYVIAELVAKVCAKDNSRFDRERFMEACNIGD